MLPSAIKPYCQFVESKALSIAWVIGGFYVVPVTHNSIRYNPFLTLDVSFGGERCVQGALSFCYLVTPFRFFSYMCLF